MQQKMSLTKKLLFFAASFSIVAALLYVDFHIPLVAILLGGLGAAIATIVMHYSNKR